MGPATSGTHVGNGLCVMFPGNKTNVECHLVNLSGTPPPPPGVTVVMTDGRYYRDNQPGGFDVTREEETVPGRDEQRRRLRHKLELKRQGRASTRGPPGT